MSKKVLGIFAAVAVIGLTIFAPPLSAVVILGTKVAVSTLLAVGIGLASAIALKPKAPRISPTATDRLYANLVVDTPRKIAFGTTAQMTAARFRDFGA